MSFLSVKQLTIIQAGHVAVNNLSFDLNKNTKLAIAGQTGSGKSSLLKMIAGLLQPDSGSVFLEEEKIPGPEEQLIPGHKKVAYLSQYFELRNHYWVHELMDMANEMNTVDANEIFKICRVDHLLHRRTNELSGGERQRSVLAKLLITKPRLLLLDEPYAHLDQYNKKIIKSVIEDLRVKMDLTCIMVTHDVEEILSWSDQLIIMKEGDILQLGKPDDIYFHPGDEYTAAILGEYNLIDPQKIPLLSVGDRNVYLNDKIFLRPGQICFAEQSVLSGEIIETIFCGNYYQYRVLVDGNILIISESGLKREKGPVNLWLTATVQ